MNAEQTSFLSQPLQLRELPLAEQPLARLYRMGPGMLSTSELLELIVGATESVGRDLLAGFQGLEALGRASLDELAGVKGLGMSKAGRIQAALELGKRLMSPSDDCAPQIKTPQDAANILSPIMGLLEQETLRVLLLDSRNRVQGNILVYQGNVDRLDVRMAELFREAIRKNAPSIILSHNHPSGDPTPSPEDVKVTEGAVSAGQMMGIDVLDHMIIGRGRWVSLRERGLGFKK
jgi:DNA repair protein RadC